MAFLQKLIHGQSRRKKVVLRGEWGTQLPTMLCKTSCMCMVDLKTKDGLVMSIFLTFKPGCGLMLRYMQLDVLE